jgi:serine/threonine protein kinase
MAKLVAQSGPTAGNEYPLNQDLVILGRQSTCDIQIVDNNASRAHCQVRRDGRLFALVDLGSRNGTQLNGKKVGERLLFFGDRIRVGEVEFLFVKEPGDVELKDLLTKYELHQKIGEGGMGIVFKAQQRSMAREIALKILAPKYAHKPQWVEQFINEARAAGKLNHQNIIQVHDVSTENDIHYFSMEFVDGPTCMQMLKEHGVLDVEAALEITRQVARALDYAHGHRLIHQDIKPDNIMVGSNEVVKLADLGISKTFDEIAAEEGPKKIMGTPHYMSPEAALGKKIDHRVDLYSLGATLYHLLSGKTPFHGTNPTDVLKAHVMEPLPPLQDLNPAVPEDVLRLIERMMAKNPDERIQTAKDIEAEIDRILAGKGFAKDKAGSETVKLRRYAQGKPGPTDNAMMTPEESGQVDVPARSRSTLLPILVVILVIAAVAAAVLALRAKQAPAPAPIVPAPVQAPVPPAPPSGEALAAPVAEGPDLPRIAAQLAEIEREMSKPSADLKLGDLRRMLGEIPADGLTAQLAARRAASAERIETLVRRRQMEQITEAFTAVEAEADKLVEEHNYDLAKQRLEAFKGRNDPAVKSRWQESVASVDKAKQDYTVWLTGQIKLLTARKDLAALKALRDGLPQAWLSTPQEQDLAKAIEGVGSERLAASNAVAAQAGKLLSVWNFAGLADLARSQRKDLDGTPAAARFDACTEAAKKLSELAGVVSERIRAAQKVRYHGVIGGFTDPDIVGGNLENGLELKESSGGAVYLRWSKLTPKELQSLAAVVLKADAEPYQAAIGVLETAGK